ncbi:MAG: hypothetical protein D6687_11920 [Acidobacteria bacterium]|jgi:succinyl-CoA synthetase beta subunit|nr:MAG: hypothetical protein D6687_11920 [Acidobacteriota bacterium]GIU82418.1 MAG: hypothetical protein KatS3mg006_1482 [Pyrinomonadaceae bacterium]
MAKLHEYQAKEILRAHGIETPRGRVVFSAEEASKVAENLGGKVVVKAQIHSTSRAAKGGIKFANSPEEAKRVTSEMLGKLIGENFCEAVLIEEKLEIEQEFYLGFIIDTVLKRPILIFSEVGGSGIEERAETTKKLVCSVRREPEIQQIKQICSDERIASVLQKLYRVAKSCEARSAEINPLALLKNGKIFALDCRISVDDYAVFRHPDLPIEIPRELGHTPTKLEKIAWEVEKNDYRGTFYFVEILQEDESKIKIGFHGAGGGGSMASLDAAQAVGLKPACYVDTSGSPPASKIYRAARIILSIPGIRGYFLSGSGVASQEQFILARGIIKAFLEVKPKIPAVLRLGGNGEEVAKELVEKYARFLPAPMEAYQKIHSAEFCASRLKDLIQAFESNKNQSEQPCKNTSKQGAKINEQNQVTPNSEAVAEKGFEETHERAFDSSLPKPFFSTSADAKLYEFKTRTGRIIFNHSVFSTESAAKIVESCPTKILKLSERNLPVLAIEPEEAERGKCIECLACEFASWESGIGGVKIEFPIKNLA